MLHHQEAAQTSKLYLASFLTTLPGFTFGSLLAFAAAGVPQLMSPNSTGILIDIYQVSWIVTIIQPTRMFGSLTTTVLQDRIGRRWCLLLCSVLQVIGCVLLFCSRYFPTFLLSFSIAGLATGMPLITSYALLSEISLIRLKGSMGSLNTLSTSGGYLYGLVSSLVVQTYLLPLTIIIPSIAFFLLSPFLPESPVWLMRQGREEEARAVLQWLRGPSYHIEPEVNEIRAVATNNAEEDMTNANTKIEFRQRVEKAWTSCKETVTDRTFILPFLIVSALFTFQALSGFDTMSYYAITIFTDWGIPPTWVAIIFQVTATVGFLLSPLVMRWLDTRPQFVSALLASAFAQAGMAASLLLPYSPISIPCLTVAGLCYGLGVGPVPYVAMSSLFPQNYKTLGVASGQVTRAAVVTAQLKAFPYLTSLIGMEGIFLFHCGALLLGALVALAALPETRNKSLIELEQIFVKKEEIEDTGS